jgi:hypothetical protein
MGVIDNVQALEHRSPDNHQAVRAPEIHLFLVWNRGFEVLDRISQDIALHFPIKDIVEVSWSNELFGRNLTRFYGIGQKHLADKERECGRGNARAFVVQDDQVLYEERPTTKGVRKVNARIFDARERYREWTGGGFLVHASLSTGEAVHDLRMLLNRAPADYLSRPTILETTVQSRCGDLVGSQGWESMEQLMLALQAVTPSVILFPGRDTGSIPPLGDQQRVTILVGDRWDAVFTLNGRRAGSSNGRIFHEADIGGQPVHFDLRQTGVGYFDPQWEREMLRQREVVDGLALLDPENHLYATLYEALMRGMHWISACDVGSGGKADWHSALERFFLTKGYRFATLQPTAVPVPGELMPLAWKLRAGLNRIAHLYSAVKRHGLSASIGIAARRIAAR